MKEIELYIVTRRDLPLKLLETFNRQTCKEFTLNIMSRYPQKWRAEDLNVDFPVKLRPVRIAYSSGTKYASCLAHNEALCYVESRYVIFLDDFVIITPIAVEKFLSWADENVWMCGGITFKDKVWSEEDGRRVMESFEEAARRFDPNYRPPLFQGKVGDLNPIEAIDFFPTEALKKVNGWDLAFDHGWGGEDFNLGKRLFRAGVNFAGAPGIHAYHFQHSHHLQEVDDPRVSSENHLYNKDTERRIPLKRVGASSAYQDNCNRIGMVEAPQGYSEVLSLLRD